MEVASIKTSMDAALSLGMPAEVVLIAVDEATAAGAAGLPGLTAIDEGGVEPSASAVPSFLNTLKQPLSYPVAIDDSGQVADGYGVQGVPWFVLASADGKVIWSWEVSTSGWLSNASLDRHIRAALVSAAKAAH